MSWSDDINVPCFRRLVHHQVWVSQFQPLSRWTMILGWGLSLESLMPADAECSSRAMLLQLLVLPVGHKRPWVISFPIEMMVGWIPSSAKLFETSSV